MIIFAFVLVMTSKYVKSMKNQKEVLEQKNKLEKDLEILQKDLTQLNQEHQEYENLLLETQTFLKKYPQNETGKNLLNRMNQVLLRITPNITEDKSPSSENQQIEGKCFFFLLT